MSSTEHTGARPRAGTWLSASIVAASIALGCSAGKAPAPPDGEARGSTGSEAVAPETDPADDEGNTLRGEHEELFALVREHGRLRLIIGLDPGPGRGVPSEEEITVLVDGWLETMPSEHVTPGRRFRSIPHLVVTVDPSGLRAVATSESVVSIELDALAGPPDSSAM